MSRSKVYLNTVNVNRINEGQISFCLNTSRWNQPTTTENRRNTHVDMFNNNFSKKIIQHYDNDHGILLRCALYSADSPLAFKRHAHDNPIRLTMALRGGPTSNIMLSFLVACLPPHKLTTPGLFKRFLSQYTILQRCFFILYMYRVSLNQRGRLKKMALLTKNCIL